MKRIFAHTVISAALALSAFAPAAIAKPGKKKHSPAYKAAVKKCNEDYAAARKEAMTKKGKERQAALDAAKRARKECIAQAPQ